MSTIDKLDQNFAVKTVIEDTLTFTDCKESPFQVYGLLSTEEGFVRMPADIASKVNANVSVLFRNTAGGRLRFQTKNCHPGPDGQYCPDAPFFLDRYRRF